jgi:hypothetical protein
MNGARQSGAARIPQDGRGGSASCPEARQLRHGQPASAGEVFCT